MIRQLVMKFMLQMHGPRNVQNRNADKSGSRKSSRAKLDFSSSFAFGQNKRTGTLKNNLLSGANAEFQGHQRQSRDRQDYQQQMQRHSSEVQNEFDSQQVASREEIGNLRDELSQSFS